MEESVVATRSQPLARITICIHASPRHVSWHACYTCIGRMYVSQGGNVFRKGAKPFRNCFPSPHRLLAPRKTRQPAHPRHEPLIYVSYETCANQVSPSTLHSIISLDPLSTDISPPPPFPPIYLSPFIGGKITKQKKYKIGLSNRRLSTRVGNDSVLGKRNSKLVGFVWICRNTGGRNEAVENYYWARWWWVV